MAQKFRQQRYTVYADQSFDSPKGSLSTWLIRVGVVATIVSMGLIFRHPLMAAFTVGSP